MIMVTVYQSDNANKYEFNCMADALAFIETCHECGAVNTSFYVRDKKENGND